uniref:PSI domain-containing protein n=1 Tax=Palpitomonas bilix TaxID=652834 RepID=A0A7S3G4B3_9EUKA
MKVALFSAVAAALFALVKADCSQYTDCSTCTMYGNCGWCSSSNTCVSGSTSGPSTGTCYGAWSWQSSQCSCSSYTSCSGCTIYSSCGWCSDTNSCLPGSNDGPYGSTTCTGDSWSTSSDQCYVDCSSYYTCEDCSSSTACGWCRPGYGDDDDSGIGSCYKGTYSSPTGGNTCSENWAYYSTSCPTGFLGMGIVAFVFVVVLLPFFLVVVIGVSAGVAARRARQRSYIQVGNTGFTTAVYTSSGPPQQQPYYAAPPVYSANPNPSAPPANGNPYQVAY